MAFDPQAATAAHIDSLGADALAKAAAYTAGNHWLLLWGLVVSGIFTWVIVRWGILDGVSARMARRGVNLRTFVVAATFFALSSLLTLPWELYADWWRESHYGRSRIDETQSDRYSLETVGLPDALASALVKTAEYRNPRPHPLQEKLFYTHPSVERRVRAAMEWKATAAPVTRPEPPPSPTTP
jgi:Zn-dependent protease with chaperone function